MKLVFLDFEFNGISEKTLNLVSVAAQCTDNRMETYRREFQFLSNNYAEARDFFRFLMDSGYTFVAYVMEAEARGLHALFGNFDWLASFKGIDLYLEYRCLLNHNHRLAYGKQYIRGKEVITRPKPPKWAYVDETEADDDLHHRPEYSLAAACYKLLMGEKIDTVEKDTVRSIIIRGDKAEIAQNIDRIQKYNWSDIVLLPRLLDKVRECFSRKGVEDADWLRGANSRADYAVRTAKMISLGYPINLDKVKKFTANTQGILNEAISEVNEHLPVFRFNKKSGKHILTERIVREWVDEQALPNWRKTDKGKTSLSKDAFGAFFDSSAVGFPGAFYRYLKTKQSLNGFLPSGGKKRFFDYVGTDGRVRPHFGIYGSQSSRSQPAATGFIFLKAHWMRNFVEASPGRALAGVDFSSQEFLIAAILSQDQGMISAYESGDVYLAFAIEAGLAPKGATKESHKQIRDRCKTLVLGISYDMGAKGLAARMKVSEEDAQNLIDTFFDIYPDYKEWKKSTAEEYQDNGCLSLPDGWMMFGDNDNMRSVCNFPIQGEGSRIMRTAVSKAQKAGLEVVFTLHDSLVIEFNSSDATKIILLKTCMSEAFSECMAPYGSGAPIRLEGEAWSKDYTTALPPPIEGIKYMSEYTDDKGARDLARFRRFFD